MIPAISFTSTYSVSSKYNGYPKFSSFYEFAIDKECSDFAGIIYESNQDENYPYYSSDSCTLIAPDKLDSDIEQFCIYNGIKYKKFLHKELLDTSNIENRIEDAPLGLRMVKIDSDKLDKLIQDQCSNLDHCSSDYEKYYKGKTDIMLKSGMNIPATTLNITSHNGNVDDILEYIERNGSDNFNKEQLFVDFIQRTDNPDHCIYFALKDLGMKYIPVYVNDSTYKVAKALDIIE